MPRNRQQTSIRIKQAAIRLLQREGFAGWGINAIARESESDKVLIYRYFKSLDGLLSEIVRETRFWPDPEALDSTTPEAFISGTIRFMQVNRISLLLTALPESHPVKESISEKFTHDLDIWLSGIREHCEGNLTDSELMRLPALIHFSVIMNASPLSDRELWNQVSPPLDWTNLKPFETFEELPTELL